MKPQFASWSEECKNNLQARLKNGGESEHPQFAHNPSNIQYDFSDRIAGLSCGGIGLVHTLVKNIRLGEAIDRELPLLKVRKAYSEADHVLNIAYNIVCGGRCLEDLETQRNNEAYLDALGASRIPDPTTEGDFLRRFWYDDVVTLMSVINQKSREIWDRNPENKRRNAIIDVDGTIAGTSGECKEKMDMSYKGVWGFSVLAITEAQTGVHLFTVNRSGNEVSHAGAVPWIDKAVETVKGHFAGVYLRGDSGFCLTGEFDRWDDEGVKFCFSCDAHENLVEIAEKLPENRWEMIAHTGKEGMRKGKRNVKAERVEKRGYRDMKRVREHVAEFRYRPGKCRRDCRVVVTRRTVKVTKGQLRLADEVRYFFHITNIGKDEMPAGELLGFSRGRCNHENKIEQLHNGVGALRMPCSEFIANWAYMVICSLAWNLKCWLGQLMPEGGEEVIRMEYRSFVRRMIGIPCQIVKSGRRVWFRILGWTPWIDTFWKAFHRLKGMRSAPS